MRRYVAVSVLIVCVLIGSRLSRTQEIFSFEFASSKTETTTPAANTAPAAAVESAPAAATPAETQEEESFPIPDHELVVPKGVRAIFFIPHPDDESLGAAGLIQRVIASGGKACVVFVTNGDGYIEGVRTKLKRKETSSQDFIEYGKQRHDEAMQAICELGLKPEDAIFLGFPDDGIDDLWSDYWSRLKPFTSPYTRFSRPEYADSFSRWARYAGDDLDEAISQVLRQFNADWIVLPDPRDFHPDHCTTGIFVLDAARRLNQRGEVSFAATKFFTYLVHYRDYPTSSKWLDTVGSTGIGSSKTASRILSQTRWRSLPMSARELENKKNALYSHQTQIAMLGGFFKIFLRPSEVFGQLDPAQVLALPQVYAAQFQRPASLQ